MYKEYTFSFCEPLTIRGGSTYGPNRHRPPLLTDKSCNFSLFYVIFGLFSGYISHPAPPFGSRPPLFTYPGSAPDYDENIYELFEIICSLRLAIRVKLNRQKYSS